MLNNGVLISMGEKGECEVKLSDLKNTRSGGTQYNSYCVV